MSIVYNSLSDCTCLVYSRPSIKKLLDLVPQSAPFWYKIGIKLFDKDIEHHVEVIRRDYGNDVRKCCVEMFWYWLEAHPKASWQQLITALRSPGVHLHNVADTIERKFIG